MSEEKTSQQKYDDEDFGPPCIGAMLGVIVGLCIHNNDSLEEDLIPWLGVMHDDALAQAHNAVVYVNKNGNVLEVHAMLELCVALYVHHGVGRESLFGLVRDLHADISKAAADHRKAAEVESRFFGGEKRIK